MLFVLESPLLVAVLSELTLTPVALESDPVAVLSEVIPLVAMESPALVDVESEAMLAFALATSLRKRLKLMSVPSESSTFSMPLHLVRSIAARISSSSKLSPLVVSAPASVEMTTTSRPEPPEIAKVARLFRSVCDPILITNLSVPAPPTSEEAAYPESKTSVSLPRPPTRVLAPVPPTRLSLPAPPKRLSAPVPPTRVSLPAPPLMVSLPFPPEIELADALPVIVLASVFPVPFAIPVPKTKFSTFVASV